MNSRDNHRSMPSQEKILAYWENRLDVEEHECFACGAPWKLDRAHIIPLCFGGSNLPKNLHLLCAGCHSQSEGFKTYWTWFENKRRTDWKYPMRHIESLYRNNGLNLNRIARRLGKNYPVLSWKESKVISEKVVSQMISYLHMK